MLVREYDFIAMERLNVKAMSRSVRPKPDPDNPGHYLHNGRKRKSGLNRSILANRWTDILHCLEYKTKLAGTDSFRYPPMTRHAFATSADTATRTTVKAKRCSTATIADMRRTPT